MQSVARRQPHQLPNCRKRDAQVIRRALLVWCAILGVFFLVGACVMLDLDLD
jgi:hypothetical protein